MTPINGIPLDDQVLAVLRIWRDQSFHFRDSADIALILARPRFAIVQSLARLFELGLVQRLVEGTATEYRVSDAGRQTLGCCYGCSARLYQSRAFCETCGPYFSGRF